MVWAALGDVDFGLADADGFHQDTLVPGRIQGQDDIGRGARQPTQAAACGHAADEDTRIAGQVTHPHPVAQQRATRKWAGRVDCDDSHAHPQTAVAARQGVHQGRLARTRCAGEADDVRFSGVRVKRRQQAVCFCPAILDPGDDPGQRPAVAGEKLGNGLHVRRHVHSFRGG